MTVVDGVRVVSNSEVQAFKWCRRYWWLAWYRGLTARQENLTSAAALGSRVHEALAGYYVPDGELPVNPLVTLNRVQLRDAAVLDVQLAEAEYEVRDSLSETYDNLRSQFVMEHAMIEGYVAWLAETGVDSELEVLGAEKYVEASLSTPSGSSVKLIAKLDAQVRSRLTGHRRFIDHKTVGALYDPTLGINQQMLHYHLIQWLATPEGEERCEGALYNMLRKTKRTRASKPPYYARYPVNHNVHELNNYRDKLVGVITDIESVEYWLENGVSHQEVVYPTPSRDCVWKCQFFKVCRMFDDGSRVEAALEDHYVERDPLSYYGGREKSGEND